MLTMLAWGLGSRDSGAADLDDYYRALWSEGAVRDELGELLDVVDARSETRAAPSSLPPEIPLTVHARYSRAEIVAALGSGEGVKPKVTQGGILWVEQARSDVFFIDLHKAERDYSPTTMYRDYAINRELFHWESQSRQTPEQPSVQRYINHRERGTNVLLFVRDRKRDELGTSPFTFLGPVEYVDHEGQGRSPSPGSSRPRCRRSCSSRRGAWPRHRAWWGPARRCLRQRNLELRSPGVSHRQPGAAANRRQRGRSPA